MAEPLPSKQAVRVRFPSPARFGHDGPVSELSGGTARRRRRRASSAQASPAPVAEPPPIPEPSPIPEPPTAAPRPTEETHRTPRRQRTDPVERGLRDLVGAGPSQLGVSRALRGRDVNRPSAEDLAAAEQEVVVVRRHWKPSGNDF